MYTTLRGLLGLGEEVIPPQGSSSDDQVPDNSASNITVPVPLTPAQRQKLLMERRAARAELMRQQQATQGAARSRRTVKKGDTVKKAAAIGVPVALYFLL